MGWAPWPYSSEAESKGDIFIFSLLCVGGLTGRHPKLLSRLHLRCVGNAVNSFPTMQGKDQSSRAMRRKQGGLFLCSCASWMDSLSFFLAQSCQKVSILLDFSKNECLALWILSIVFSIQLIYPLIISFFQLPFFLLRCSFSNCFELNT